MNVHAPCSKAAMSLTATIDDFSNLGLSSVASSPAPLMDTPGPKSIDGYKNKESVSSASAIGTPTSGIQNDNDWVYKELAPAMTSSAKLPLFKPTPRTGRQVRKWKLKVHPAAKGQQAMTSFELKPVKLKPKPRVMTTFVSIPTTPLARQAAPNPPMLPKRNSIAVQPLSPPNLKKAELRYSQSNGELTPLLKPRPTVLFLSPHKRRRMDDNDDA